MGKTEDTRRYKWTNTATKLLVSIWSHDMVQARMKLSTRNQPVWESIARFMSRKGFNVTSLQCRTRIKNMLCNYYESVRKKDRSYIGPYFDIFQKIVSTKHQKIKVVTGQYKEIVGFDISDCEMEEPPSPVSAEKPTNEDTQDTGTGAENSDGSNQATQAPTTPVTCAGITANQESLIVKAIDNQTKVISEAIRVQTETVEKLLESEREMFEAVIHAERKSRKELEDKMDNIIRRLDSNPTNKQFSKPLPLATYL